MADSAPLGPGPPPTKALRFVSPGREAAAPSPEASKPGAEQARPERLATHGEPLPRQYVEQIPAEDRNILSFLLAFLNSEGLCRVPLYINGGYIRDLLLQKAPDDLDISLCLRECADDVTVSGLLGKLPGFAASRRELGIAEVKIATVLSNESKDKLVDTFKAHFTNDEGRKIEVDVMPTIGEETYEEGNRIPVRDQRGTPEQDALRRDLTIGSMLLHVAWADSAERGSTAQRGLCYTLLDFYGGIQDLDRGVLRAPFPSDRRVEDVRSLVLRTDADVELGRALGLIALSDEDAIQVLWWVKILRDDPLRICRALRLSAKMQFSLHESFWQATPFALQELRSKVAGSRKDTEYQKIGAYSFRACIELFELAFTRGFGPDAALRLAPALFGGQDAKGHAKTLSDVQAFDSALFESLILTLRGVDVPAFRIGGLLAAAIVAATLDGSRGPILEFQSACDGMCVSKLMRDAGLAPLQTVVKLAAPPPAGGRLERGFAAACGVSIDTVCLHVQLWEAKQLHAGAKEWPAICRAAVVDLAVAMLRHSEPLKAELIAAPLEALARPRPPVKGSVLSSGILEVPPMLRGQLVALLEVSLRLLRYDAPAEDAEQLQQLFKQHPLLCEALSSSVWFEGDGKTLREEFRRGRGAPKKK